jgi:hypothetical protein
MPGFLLTCGAERAAPSGRRSGAGQQAGGARCHGCGARLIVLRIQTKGVKLQ